MKKEIEALKQEVEKRLCSGDIDHLHIEGPYHSFFIDGRKIEVFYGFSDFTITIPKIEYNLDRKTAKALKGVIKKRKEGQDV